MSKFGLDRVFKTLSVLGLVYFTEFVDGSVPFDNFLMMASALMGASGANRLRHSIVDLMFFVSVGLFENQLV
jgi:hypothetical protein